MTRLNFLFAFVRSEAEGESAGIPGLPSIFEVLEGVGVHVPHFLHMFLFSLLASLLLFIPAFLVGRKLQLVPAKMQTIFEILMLELEKFFSPFIGQHAKTYLPLLVTVFLYILLMNLIGLLPLLHAPTSSMSTTLGLAVVVFFVVQIEGIRARGVKGYLSHFLGEPLWLAPLQFPLHILGEFIRPLSLSLRLFGNILAKEVLLTALLLFLSPLAFGILTIIMEVPILILGILFSIIQAVIFTALTAVYIAGAVTVHHEHVTDKHLS